MQLRVIAAHSHGRIAQVRGLNWQSSRDYPVRAARKPIDNQEPRADVNNNNDGQIRKTSLLIFAKCKLKVRGQQSPSRPELGVVVMAGGSRYGNSGLQPSASSRDSDNGESEG
jgi:hypothetical protein